MNSWNTVFLCVNSETACPKGTGKASEADCKSILTDTKMEVLGEGKLKKKQAHKDKQRGTEKKGPAETPASHPREKPQELIGVVQDFGLSAVFDELTLFVRLCSGDLISHLRTEMLVMDEVSGRSSLVLVAVMGVKKVL